MLRNHLQRLDRELELVLAITVECRMPELWVSFGT